MRCGLIPAARTRDRGDRRCRRPADRRQPTCRRDPACCGWLSAPPRAFPRCRAWPHRRAGCDVVGVALALQVGERVLAHDADVDALEGTGYPQPPAPSRGPLRAAGGNRRRRSSTVARSAPILHIGCAERAGHHGNGVGVLLPGGLARRAAVAEDRFEAVAHGAGIDAAAAPARSALPSAPAENRIISICSSGA